MSGYHVLDDNFLKYILRFPSYEDYGIHKKTEYETDLEAESLDVEEVSNMTSNSSLEKLGKKSYKDIIWQWDDAAWIMCAVLMTFTMQVVFVGVQGDDLKVIANVDHLDHLYHLYHTERLCNLGGRMYNS